MNKTNGGPAFLLGNTEEEWMNGMTLRDYFAAKAMQGLIAQLPHDLAYDAKSIASESYGIAEAMLAARDA